jgi:hypothetical protein
MTGLWSRFIRSFDLLLTPVTAVPQSSPGDKSAGIDPPS